MYNLGLDWVYLASHILQLPSSEELQSKQNITMLIYKRKPGMPKGEDHSHKSCQNTECIQKHVA